MAFRLLNTRPQEEYLVQSVDSKRNSYISQQVKVSPMPDQQHMSTSHKHNLSSASGSSLGQCSDVLCIIEISNLPLTRAKENTHHILRLHNPLLSDPRTGRSNLLLDRVAIYFCRRIEQRCVDLVD